MEFEQDESGGLITLPACLDQSDASLGNRSIAVSGASSAEPGEVLPAEPVPLDAAGPEDRDSGAFAIIPDNPRTVSQGSSGADPHAVAYVQAVPSLSRIDMITERDREYGDSYQGTLNQTLLDGGQHTSKRPRRCHIPHLSRLVIDAMVQLNYVDGKKPGGSWTLHFPRTDGEPGFGKVEKNCKVAEKIWNCLSDQVCLVAVPGITHGGTLQGRVSGEKFKEWFDDKISVFRAGMLLKQRGSGGMGYYLDRDPPGDDDVTFHRFFHLVEGSYDCDADGDCSYSYDEELLKNWQTISDGLADIEKTKADAKKAAQRKNDILVQEGLRTRNQAVRRMGDRPANDDCNAGGKKKKNRVGLAAGLNAQDEQRRSDAKLWVEVYEAVLNGLNSGGGAGVTDDAMETWVEGRRLADVEQHEEAEATKRADVRRKLWQEILEVATSLDGEETLEITLKDKQNLVNDLTAREVAEQAALQNNTRGRVNGEARVLAEAITNLQSAAPTHNISLDMIEAREQGRLAAREKELQMQDAENKRQAELQEKRMANELELKRKQMDQDHEFRMEQERNKAKAQADQTNAAVAQANFMREQSGLLKELISHMRK